MAKGSDEFAAHIATRKVHPPRLCFKYTSMTAASAIIGNETVICRSPLEFNDPFDGQWNTQWQLQTKTFNGAIVERWFSRTFDPHSIHDAELREWVISEGMKLQSLQPPERRARLQELKNQLEDGNVLRVPIPDLLRRLRVFCLSQIPDSILMWAYYAAGHEGVVLAFDTKVLENAWQRPLGKVQYLSTLPKIIDPRDYLDFFTRGGDTPELRHGDRASRLWTLTKAQAWSHEKEWRFVFAAEKGDNSHSLHQPIPVSALHGIAAGCKTDRDQFKELTAQLLAKKPGAEFWQTERHASRFDLVAVRQRL